MFSEGYYGPLGKIPCPSNGRPRRAHSSPCPRATSHLQVLGWLTQTLGWPVSGPCGHGRTPASAWSPPAGASPVWYWQCGEQLCGDHSPHPHRRPHPLSVLRSLSRSYGDAPYLQRPYLAAGSPAPAINDGSGGPPLPTPRPPPRDVA